MMKKLILNKDEVISASEINDFLFCKMSFLLKRANIRMEEKEDTPTTEQQQLQLINIGKVKHQEIAKKTEEVIKKEEIARNSYIIGLLIIVLSILIMILFLL